MPNLSDIDIYKKIKSRDEAAFNLIFDKYYTTLCLFCCKYVKDLDLSRSLVQQLFVDLWVKKENIHIDSSLKSYLFNATKNKAIDYLRWQKAKVQITSDIENTRNTPFKDLIAEAEVNKKINDCINELPEKCREVFVLCRFENLRYKQVAEKLGISIKTVEMQMSIALKRLRNNLSDYKTINLYAIFFSKK